MDLAEKAFEVALEREKTELENKAKSCEKFGRSETAKIYRSFIQNLEIFELTFYSCLNAEKAKAERGEKKLGTDD